MKSFFRYRVCGGAFLLLYVVIAFIVYNLFVKQLLQPSISPPKKENMNDISKQSDPDTVNKIRKTYLYPPSSEEYNLNDMGPLDPSMGQSSVIRKFFKNKKEGFFVECGAYDGETRSNTLYLERFLNWKGLLIEGDQTSHPKIIKAWFSPTCLSIRPRSMVVKYLPHQNLGKIHSEHSEGNKAPPAGISIMTCFPFYSYMLALNVTVVDYFSLDVEGYELQVLQTIPFDKIYIKTLSVEFAHVREGNFSSGKEALNSYMSRFKYVPYSEVTNDRGLANDIIFIHEDELKLQNVQKEDGKEYQRLK